MDHWIDWNPFHFDFHICACISWALNQYRRHTHTYKKGAKLFILENWNSEKWKRYWARPLFPINVSQRTPFVRMTVNYNRLFMNIGFFASTISANVLPLIYSSRWSMRVQQHVLGSPLSIQIFRLVCLTAISWSMIYYKTRQFNACI